MGGLFRYGFWVDQVRRGSICNGTQKVKVAPWSRWLTTLMPPLCARKSALTIARPMPGTVQQTLPAAAIKFVKNICLFRVVNPLPLVSDADQEPICFQLGLDAHRRTHRGIPGGIFQQVPQHPANQLPIQ